MSAVSDFLAQYGDLAATAATSAGLSQSEVLGQWGLETAWGQNFAGANNPGNVSPGGKVADYATIDQGTQAYLDALSYEKIANLANDPAQFATALQAAGYATDPNYSTKLQGAISTAAKAGASTGSQANAVTMVNQNAAQSKPDSGNVVTNWIGDHVANYGIIFFGGVLVVGALLISQRQNIVNIAGKVAAVA